MNDPALKSMAKNLVQVRNQRDKLYGTKAHLGAVGMQASAMASQVAASSAVGSVSGAMKTANDAVNAKEMSKIMAEFTRQNEVMEVRQEMMDDALTDVFDADGVEDEADEVTGQVLAELGIEMDKQFVGLATPSALPAGQQQVAEEEDDLPDLKARLDAL
jgi:division protein CdvB (Snf7/Vps24/ESCRT-III family)